MKFPRLCANFKSWSVELDSSLCQFRVVKHHLLVSPCSHVFLILFLGITICITIAIASGIVI